MCFGKKERKSRKNFVNTEIMRIFVGEMDYTINVRGRLLDLSKPIVMGILNATPDSFYAASRQQTKVEIARRAAQIVEEGAAIIDIGGCSTRPDSQPATEAEETERLRLALDIVRRELPEAIISVDTFRMPDSCRPRSMPCVMLLTPPSCRPLNLWAAVFDTPAI